MQDRHDPEVDPPTSSTSPPARLPVSIDMDQSTIGEAANSLLKVFAYSASISERTLRSASALAGGLVRESANWLIPSAFRNSKSYSIFVRQMLDFVVNDLGGVKRVLSGAKLESRPEQVDLARKTVGNLLDMTAFATFHLSPITVLAVFSEVAYGSKTYLEQLSVRLKEQGVIDKDLAVDSANDLLKALQEASGNAVGMFDQPPVSIDGLRKTIEEIKDVVAAMEPTQVLPVSEMEQLWSQMELAAYEQHASIWDISTTMSMVTLSNLQTAETATTASLDIEGSLFEEHIIQHYWRGLREIESRGLIPTLSKASSPYLEAVWANFSIDGRTWTEQLLSGELLRWGWSQLSWPKLSREAAKGGS